MDIKCHYAATIKKRDRIRSWGSWEIEENRGKGKAGETTSQAKHEIKMRLRCILNCHDADDDGDARSRPGKGVAAPARRSAYNFIFHTQLSLTKCEGRGPKASILLGFLPLHTLANRKCASNDKGPVKRIKFSKLDLKNVYPQSRNKQRNRLRHTTNSNILLK